VLQTKRNRLYRCPHIAIAGDQVPASCNEVAGLNLPAKINRLWDAIATILQRLGPGNVAIAFHHRVCASEIDRFLGIKGGVNSAEDHVRAALPRQLSNFVSAQCVRRVNADADRIASLNLFRSIWKRVSSTRMGSPKLLGLPQPERTAIAG
jgi:hypothetical protein